VARVTRKQRSYEAHGKVDAAPPDLFDALDDPRRLSRHMDKRSMAMMGSAMDITTDERGGRDLGSVMRMRGRVLGVRIELEQVVTERQPPTSKAWETVGEPRLMVIGSYRMGFRIQPAAGGSELTVYIEYKPPRGLVPGLLGAVLGSAYAKWCCERMVADARQAFSAGRS
jgi:hypothetical protein